MPIDSNLSRARVGVYNCNMRSCKKEPNIHIKHLTTIPLKKSFKISFFRLIVLFLLVVFLSSSFIFTFEGASKSITKTNLDLSDYISTIRCFINNLNTFYFYYQEILKLIPVQNDHLTSNFVTGT